MSTGANRPTAAIEHGEHFGIRGALTYRERLAHSRERAA